MVIDQIMSTFTLPELDFLNIYAPFLVTANSLLGPFLGRIKFQKSDSIIKKDLSNEINR